MTFESMLKQTVEKSAETRYKLNEYHWPKLNGIQKVMAEVFHIPLSWVKNLHQAWYYKNGGYPGPDSPPRFDPPTRKMAEMYVMLNHIGKGHYIENVLSDYGLKLEIVEPTKFEFSLTDLDDKFSKWLDESELDINFNSPLSDEEIFDYFLEAMEEVQADICGMADSIKIDAYNDINIKFPKKLKKNKFLNVVKIKAQSKKDNIKALKSKDETQEMNDNENHSLDVVINK